MARAVSADIVARSTREDDTYYVLRSSNATYLPEVGRLLLVDKYLPDPSRANRSAGSALSFTPIESMHSPFPSNPTRSLSARPSGNTS